MHFKLKAKCMTCKMVSTLIGFTVDVAENDLPILLQQAPDGSYNPRVGIGAPWLLSTI